MKPENRATKMCLELLQNSMECQCCREIPRCLDSLNSDLVLKEVKEPPECIVEHPGFRSVCLDRWSLRQAAAKYLMIDGRKYRQTGLEET